MLSTTLALVLGAAALPTVGDFSTFLTAAASLSGAAAVLGFGIWVYRMLVAKVSEAMGDEYDGEPEDLDDSDAPHIDDDEPDWDNYEEIPEEDWTTEDDEIYRKSGQRPGRFRGDD